MKHVNLFAAISVSLLSGLIGPAAMQEHQAVLITSGLIFYSQTAEVVLPGVSKSDLGLLKGKTHTLKVTNKRKDAVYTFTTDNKKIAAVDKNGKITGAGQGETIICCMQKLDGITEEVGACRVVVLTKKPALSFTVDAPVIEQGADGYEFLPLAVSGSVKVNKLPGVSFTSKNEKVAKIDGEGRLVPKKVGKTTITMTCDFGEASLDISVIKPVPEVKIASVSKITDQSITLNFASPVTELQAKKYGNAYSRIISENRSDIQWSSFSLTKGMKSVTLHGLFFVYGGNYKVSFDEFFENSMTFQAKETKTAEPQLTLTQVDGQTCKVTFKNKLTKSQFLKYQDVEFLFISKETKMSYTAGYTALAEGMKEFDITSSFQSGTYEVIPYYRFGEMEGKKVSVKIAK